MLGIHHYFWRLLPANPILLRVVETGGKRKRDLFIRCGYLGLLVFFVVASLMSGGGSLGSGSLDQLAQTSGSIFQNLSYLQLALVALLAPIFTAGAITPGARNVRRRQAADNGCHKGSKQQAHSVFSPHSSMVTTAAKHQAAGPES